MTKNDKIKKIEEKLEEHENRIKFLEDTFARSKIEEDKKVQNRVGIKKLAKKIDVSLEKIEELFDVEDNTLTVVKIAGEDDRDKTQKTSLAVLIGYKYILGIKEILASEIRRNVAENRVSINNFATYLNEIIPSLIRRKGKHRSPKTTYKLTTFGEVEAKAVLKKLCE